MKPCPSPDCDSPPDEPPTYIHADAIYVECPCGTSGPHGYSNDEALQLWNDLPRADGLAQATEIAAKVVADKRVVDLQQERDNLRAALREVLGTTGGYLKMHGILIRHGINPATLEEAP